MDRKNKLLLILKKSLDKYDFMFNIHPIMGFKIQSHGDNQKIYLFELIKIFFRKFINSPNIQGMFYINSLKGEIR